MYDPDKPDELTPETIEARNAAKKLMKKPGIIPDWMRTELFGIEMARRAYLPYNDPDDDPDDSDIDIRPY